MDDIYLTDIAMGDDFIVKDNGDFELAEGLDNVKSALFRRLITTPGSLIHRPTYGVGIKRWQGALNKLDNQRSMAKAIQENFANDSRVESVSGVSITNSDNQPELVKILVRVKVVGYGEQVFSFIPFGDVV